MTKPCELSLLPSKYLSNCHSKPKLAGLSELRIKENIILQQRMKGTNAYILGKESARVEEENHLLKEKISSKFSYFPKRQGLFPSCQVSQKMLNPVEDFFLNANKTNYFATRRYFDHRNFDFNQSGGTSFLSKRTFQGQSLLPNQSLKLESIPIKK